MKNKICTCAPDMMIVFSIVVTIRETILKYLLVLLRK